MGGGDGFTVDYDALDEMASTLQSLADRFEGLEDQMEGYGDAVAYEEVADKLERVASNWSDDRGEIVDTMEASAEYATQAAAAYRDTDNELASEYSD